MSERGPSWLRTRAIVAGRRINLAVARNQDYFITASVGFGGGRALEQLGESPAHSLAYGTIVFVFGAVLSNIVNEKTNNHPPKKR